MIEVSKENFKEVVLQSEQPVLVDIWGPACQPCLNLLPAIEELSETYEDVKFVKMNSAQNRRLCIDYKVMGLPALLLFKNGEEIRRISGGIVTKQDVENLVREII